MVKFTGKIFKTGNSFVITIPKNIRETLELLEGDLIDVTVEGISSKPKNSRKKK